MNKLTALKGTHAKAVEEIKSSISDSTKLQSILSTIMIVAGALFFFTVVITLASENILIANLRFLIIFVSGSFFGTLELSIFIVKVITKQLNSIILINALVENNEDK